MSAAPPAPTATSLAPAAAPGVADARPVDFGRVGVVTLFLLTALVNLTTLSLRLTGDAPAAQKAAEAASSVLALSFCALVVRAYLRRGRATATDRTPVVWLVAPVATVVPLVMAAIPSRPGGIARTVAELALTMAGLAWSLWALRCLATNLSIVPQARVAITHGPYRFVRHPLYVGEMVALAGLALHVGRWLALVVLVVEIGLQFYRASREERLLARELPAYGDYAARTSRLIPGVW